MPSGAFSVAIHADYFRVFEDADIEILSPLQFTPAVSFLVECDTQEEVDYYWSKLSAAPKAEACGWLKDKFGVSWQVAPKQLGQLINDPDPVKAGRVMQTMMKMKKIDIAGLQRAHDAA